ncbi:hypothetical protein MAR_034316 [Mya arenaria]|uniref:Uncharacterized protein n=1 Tax=Mya arenaria TaxID=6604 RepID=A0ABY7GE23_MYAAR|nr:hypothetical protein MAR_034316 [Mya arenaria]
MIGSFSCVMRYEKRSRYCKVFLARETFSFKGKITKSLRIEKCLPPTFRTLLNYTNRLCPCGAHSSVDVYTRICFKWLMKEGLLQSSSTTRFAATVFMIMLHNVI